MFCICYNVVNFTVGVDTQTEYVYSGLGLGLGLLDSKACGQSLERPHGGNTSLGAGVLLFWRVLNCFRCLSLRVFLIAVRCLAILILSDCAVWPTYCFLHFLQWIRYTTWGVLQFALPCVL